MEVRMSLHIRETAGDGVRGYAPVMPLVGRQAEFHESVDFGALYAEFPHS
jgi:hypothetical protein